MFVHLVGEFRLVDADGVDRTPKSAKARAVLAMLARTPGGTRPRGFLVDTLWSDRGRDQAAGSLRQALSNIRKALGPLADWLDADRRHVSIGSHKTDLEEDPAGAMDALSSGRQLLEGLRITDPAFLSWLNSERRRLRPFDATGPARLLNGHDTSAENRTLVLRIHEDTKLSSLPAHLLGDAITNLMSDFADLDVFFHPPDDSVFVQTEGALALDIRAADFTGGRTHVIARLTTPENGRLLWSRTTQIDASDDELFSSEEIPSLAYEAAEVLLTGTGKAHGDLSLHHRIDGLVARAVSAMFSYDAAQLRLAEALLAEADTLLPEPRVAAWRSMVRQIMIVERTEPDRERLANEAERFVADALQTCKGNALVLGLVAQLGVMLDGDLGTSQVLANDAVRVSPNNAFSHGAYATVALRAGRPKEALAAALRASALARRSPYIHWFHGLVGLSALALGRYDLSIRYYEMAHARAPHFRSAVRHLLCLYETVGDRPSALRMQDKLSRLEPGFQIERLREDHLYPAHTLRQMKMVPQIPLRS